MTWEEQWVDRAACQGVDPEIFFPEKGGSSLAAKAVCMGCEVRIQCLNYALRRNEHNGVWGGMNERERRRLKKLASMSETTRGGEYGSHCEVQDQPELRHGVGS